MYALHLIIRMRQESMGPQITFTGHEINKANAQRPPREMPQGTVKQALLIPDSIMTNIFLTD
jgi:hypothetical protein